MKLQKTLYVLAFVAKGRLVEFCIETFKGTGKIDSCGNQFILIQEIPFEIEIPDDTPWQPAAIVGARITAEEFEKAVVVKKLAIEDIINKMLAIEGPKASAEVTWNDEDDIPF